MLSEGWQVIPKLIHLAFPPLSLSDSILSSLPLIWIAFLALHVCLVSPTPLLAKYYPLQLWLCSDSPHRLSYLLLVTTPSLLKTPSDPTSPAPPHQPSPPFSVSLSYFMAVDLLLEHLASRVAQHACTRKHTGARREQGPLSVMRRWWKSERLSICSCTFEDLMSKQ